MRIFIAGVDGYLGWSLAMYLTKRGHEVAGADCYHRGDWLAEMGSHMETDQLKSNGALTPCIALRGRFIKFPQKFYLCASVPSSDQRERA